LELPLISFLRSFRRERDLPALVLVTLVSIYTILALLLPLSRTVRLAAEARFQLRGWPPAVWATFQPLPSMYNFENRWTVSFEGTPAAGVTAGLCPGSGGYINHHIYHRLVVPASRVRFEQCGLPARVRFVSTYRGTTLETTYMVTRGDGEHGLVISPVRD